jgi:uncharacterized membrane protein (UPF0127 family)
MNMLGHKDSFSARNTAPTQTPPPGNHRSIHWLSLGLSFWLMGCTVAQNPVDSTRPMPSPSATPATVPAPTIQEDLAQVLPITAEAEIAGQMIQLEVARTPEQQARGLMYRPALPDDRGMLFPFEPPRSVRFWMENTPEPLDMVFLLNGEVKAIAANVPPCTTRPCPTYGPGTRVNQVIELRAGRAAELGLKAGDQITIRFFDLEQPSP